MLVFQFIFQIVMLFDGPYGSQMRQGTRLEVILRLMGLGRLDQGLWMAVQLLMPDLGILVISNACKYVCSQTFVRSAGSITSPKGSSRRFNNREYGAVATSNRSVLGSIGDGGLTRHGNDDYEREMNDSASASLNSSRSSLHSGISPRAQRRGRRFHPGGHGSGGEESEAPLLQRDDYDGAEDTVGLFGEDVNGEDVFGEDYGGFHDYADSPWMVCSRRTYIASTPLLYGFSLFLAGVAMPSLLSGAYFLWLLILLGFWAMNIRLTSRASQVWNGVLVYAIFHCVLLYLYQFDFMQILIPPTNNFSEALGLIPFVNHTDPGFDGGYNGHVPWFSYFYVFGVILLIVSLCVEWHESVLPGDQQWTFASYLGAAVSPILPSSTRDSYRAWEEGLGFLSKNGIAIRFYDWFMMQNYMLSNVLMTAWGVAFHSWLALVILLWSFYGFLSARENFLRTMPYLVGYVAIVTACDYAWQINGIAIADYVHVGLYRDSKPGVVMSIKMLLVSVFAFTCRNRWRRSLEEGRDGYRTVSDTTVDLMSADEDDNGGGSERPDGSEDEDGVYVAKHRRSRVLSISLDKAIQKWKAIWSVALSVTVHSSYLLALLALYFCSLRDVNFFNAGYFAVFIVFWIFPSTASRYWIMLLMYCQAVIFLIYCWSFPVIRSGFYFLEPYAGLIGLNSKKGTTLQMFLTWHLVILAFSVVQFHTYQVLARRGDLRGAIEHIYYMDTQEESEEAKLSFPRLVLVVFNDHWLMWSYAAFLVIGLRGNVSLFKLLYIVMLFTCLTCMHVFHDSKTIVRRIFNVFVVYSGMVLGSMYIIQFDEIYNYLKRYLSTEDMADIGLDKAETSDLFKHLFGPTLVLFAAVVQTRLFSKPEDSTTYGLPLEEAIMRGRTDNWLAQFISFVKRVLILHTRKFLQFSIFIVISSEISVVTVLSAAGLVIYMPHYLISYSIGLVLLLWFELVTMMKLVFQLNFVTVAREGFFTEDNLRFFGFVKNDKPGDYVTWFIISILLLIMQELTRQWDREKQIAQHGTFDALKFTPLFIVSDESSDDYSSLLLKLKQILNTFFDDFGFECCCVVVAITGFTRLDAYGLIYFITIGVFMSSREAFRRSFWNVFMYANGIFFFLQYTSLIEFPTGTVAYPWLHWPSMARDIVQRWLYFPPGQNEDAIVADFFLYFFSSLLGYSYMKKCRDVTSTNRKPTDFTAIRPRTSLISFKLFIFRNFYWFVLVVVFLAGCNKTDLISFGYILWCFDLLRKGELLDVG